MSTDQALAARAQDELACRLIELSELAAGLAELTAGGRAAERGEVILFARRLRLLSQTVPDAAIRFERATGAEWGQLCIALGIGYEEAEDTYEPAFERWASGRTEGLYPGLPKQLGQPSVRWPADPAERHAAVHRWLTFRRNTGGPETAARKSG